MNVTIDSDELNRLQNEIIRLRDEKRNLEKDLTAYREDKVEESIKRAANSLFQAYMREVFKQLGFNEEYNHTVHFDCGVGYSEWHVVENIKVSLGATVTEGFRSAFLRIGVITKTEEQRKNESLIEKYK